MAEIPDGPAMTPDERGKLFPSDRKTNPELRVQAKNVVYAWTSALAGPPTWNDVSALTDLIEAELAARDAALRDLDSSVLQDDLRDMLRALGLPDGARPQSPHEVFRECVSAVSALHAALREARAEIERLLKVAEAARPIAAAAADLLASTRDTSEIWEMPAAMSITAGDLRRMEKALVALDAAASGDRRPAGDVSGDKWRPGQRKRPELEALIQRARSAYDAMTPEQQAAHDNEQRESFARRTVSGPELVEVIQRREDAVKETIMIPIVGYEDGVKEGATAERAEIVAAMRDWGLTDRDRNLLQIYASAIERGEHKQSAPGADRAGSEGEGE